jgi:hypothetical protein
MDHTTFSAAAYLAAHGYMVSRGRVGGRGAPAPDTIKRWCERGLLAGARRAGWVWLIPQATLDQLIAKQAP